MNPKRAGIIAILFILIIVALWVTANYLPARNTTEHIQDTSAITLKHSARNGEQIYSGTAQMNAPCDQLASAISVAYTEPPTATIDLKTERPAGVVCEKRQTPAEFVVSLISSEIPKIAATFDGKPLTVTVVEQ
jgi:hypothetical protein